MTSPKFSALKYFSLPACQVGAADDLRSPDHSGGTPLFWACAGGHLDVAKWLVEAGAAEDIWTKNDYDEAPLHRSCFGGHVDVVNWLFEVCLWPPF